MEPVGSYPRHVDARAIVDFLKPELDERAVLSFLAERDANGLSLDVASLLIGPADMAESSWPAWRKQVDDVVNVEFPQPEFTHDVDRWFAGRKRLSIDEAAKWLESALREGLASLAPMKQAVVDVGAAEAPIHVFPGRASDVSLLVMGAQRPTRGFFFRDRADRWVQDVPMRWSLEGLEVYNAASELLGIFIPDQPDSKGAPAGIFVGRVERRAWLEGVRGGVDLETFDVRIGLDPRRIDVADLEIEFEEHVRGEVVLNQRVRLEDVATRNVRGAPRLTVALPTLGRKVAHGVRLRDRDGVLLDMTDTNYLIESISLKFRIADSEEEVVVGERKDPPTLLERAARVDHVTKQFADWFREGLTEQVFFEEEEARSALRVHLQGARGELRIFDPWFGRQESDWHLLDNLEQPIRLLTGAAAKKLPSPDVSGLTVRVWRERPAPFHDRAYLWEGGGVHVGTSPNGFGGRLFMMRRLGAVAADELLQRFESWWGSDRADQLEPPAAT